MDTIKIFDINQCLSFISICSTCNQFRELLESKRNVGIRLQANADVRIFDIRIKATPIGMATYYGNAKLDPAEKHKRGAYGEGLDALLTDAKDFVENEGRKEFLILKFDKCKNYQTIARECLFILGKTLFTGTGSLNTKTLRELKGKVIIVFTQEGLNEIGSLYDSTHGVFGCKSLDLTKQPPAKAGGFELRTGSPDTRRLNDAYYGGSILNSSFGLGSK